MKYEFRWLQKKTIEPYDWSRPDLKEAFGNFITTTKTSLQYRYIEQHGEKKDTWGIWSEWQDVPVVEEDEKEKK